MTDELKSMTFEGWTYLQNEALSAIDFCDDGQRRLCSKAQTCALVDLLVFPDCHHVRVTVEETGKEG